jgi:Asp-tRNA(Asn)/Glu-tRNA(Gln) amidotransferase A subunit family amidase
MQGFRTSCGSRFYRELHGIAQQDSAVVARLRRSGAIILGKTHLHQLAYGITGENRDYGDCAQPGSPGVLTGGSSSGAAASVMEGSAVAAIGTDTGGSIRAPAALCGLAGYRSSLGLGGQEIWRGGYHLAPSFDTLGWLFRDLRDGPVLAHALFGIQVPREVANSTPRIGVPNADFLHDCEPRVWAAFEAWRQRLRGLGAVFSTFDAAFWSDGMEIFAGIQAHEAATIHRGHFDHFEATIAERLKWGESIPASEVRRLRSAHIRFREQMDQLFNEFDFLMLPSSPLSALPFGRDHSLTRGRILRYTVPASLSGNPVVALPADGGGVQLIASRDADTELLALAAKLGEKLAQLEIARL